MEASGAHTPDTGPTAAPTERKAGALIRVGAVLLALLLAFITAVAVLVVLDISDTATCGDVFSGEADFNDDNECYDGSSTTKLVTLVLGAAGAIFAAIATLLALVFAARGHGGRRLVMAIVAGAVLLGLSLLIG